MRSTGMMAAAVSALVALSSAGFAQTAVVFDPPDPAHFFINTKFGVIGDVGFVPSENADVLWSFSLVTGEALDPDGLALPFYASYATVFSDSRLALRCFPSIVVVDASDPTDLRQLGSIPGGGETNMVVDPDSVIGYIAAYWGGSPPGKAFSFNVETIAMEDPNGLDLPGDPERLAVAGDRLAITDYTHGDIMVVDISDPADLALAGSIPLPEPTSFSSSNNIVIAADGRTGFVASNERVLYSFDVMDLSLLDTDGLTIGEGGWAGYIAIHGDTLACTWCSQTLWRGGLVFVDATDPTDLRIISEADLGEDVLLQGSANPAFTRTGEMAAVAGITPGDFVHSFKVSTGERISEPFAVDDQPNYLTVFPPNDHVGVVCGSAAHSSNVWIIDGLFGPADACDYLGRCLTDMYLYWEWGNPPMDGGREYTIAVHDGAGVPIPYVMPPGNRIAFMTDTEGVVFPAPGDRPGVFYSGVIVAYDPATCDTAYTLRVPGSWQENHGLAFHDLTPGLPGNGSFWYTKLGDDSLFHLDETGTPIGAYHAYSDSIMGLAFDRGHEHLWGVVSGSPDMLVEYDVSSGVPVRIQGPLPVPWASGGSGHGAAGLEYDGDWGLLLAVNRSTGYLESLIDNEPGYGGPPDPDEPGVSWASSCNLGFTASPWGIGYLGYGDSLFVSGNASGGPFPLDLYAPPVLTGVEEREASPVTAGGALSQNRPNPFNPLTEIRYTLPGAAHVRLEIFDVQGKRVAVLVDRGEEAGMRSVEWDASSLPSGIYFCRLEAGEFLETRKMILAR